MLEYKIMLIWVTSYDLKTVGTLLVSLYKSQGKTQISESFCGAGAFTCSVFTLTMLIKQQSLLITTKTACGRTIVRFTAVI